MDSEQEWPLKLVDSLSLEDEPKEENHYQLKF